MRWTSPKERRLHHRDYEVYEKPVGGKRPYRAEHFHARDYDPQRRHGLADCDADGDRHFIRRRRQRRIQACKEIFDEDAQYTGKQASLMLRAA